MDIYCSRAFLCVISSLYSLYTLFIPSLYILLYISVFYSLSTSACFYLFDFIFQFVTVTKCHAFNANGVAGNYTVHVSRGDCVNADTKIKVLTNDTSTGVSTVRVENIRKTSSGLYNISGQRVNKSHKGIVIGKHKNSSIISTACPPLSLSDCKAPARQYLRRALRLSPCLSVAE